MKRTQMLFDHEALIEAIRTEMRLMTPQELARLAGGIFSVRLHPIGSKDGQRYITQDKVVNRTLIEAGCKYEPRKEVMAVIKEVRSKHVESSVFTKSMIALALKGIHLPASELQTIIAQTGEQNVR